MQHAKRCQPVKSHWAAAVHAYLCAARLCHLVGLKEMLIFPYGRRSWIQSLFLHLSAHSLTALLPLPLQPKAAVTSWQPLGPGHLLTPLQIFSSRAGSRDSCCSLWLPNRSLTPKTCFTLRLAQSYYVTRDKEHQGIPSSQ